MDDKTATVETPEGEEGAKSKPREDAWYPPKQRDLAVIRQLVSKDFKLKYRRSALGVAWSVLNPLLMMIVMAAVFSSFMRFGSDAVVNFPLYLIIGNTTFTLLSDSTNGGMGSILGAASLLKKVKINRWVFPVQKVLSALVNYAFSLIAVALVMLFFRIPLTPLALLLPVGLLLMTVFCIGLSFFLAAASVFFRDVMHLWGVILTAWTYATPIFYVIDILPGWMRTFENFNPLYLFITFFRDVLLFQRVPTLSLWIRLILFALVSLGIGYAVFHRHEHKFILFI